MHFCGTIRPHHGCLRPLRTALKAYDFFRQGAILKTSGGSEFYVECGIQNQYVSAGMPETTNSILRVGQGSSVLGIRVGVPHLTKFDVRGVRRWRGFDIGSVVLMSNVSRGIDAPAPGTCIAPVK